ncbi:MAG: hypothetical protein WB566_05680 [Terriglobales bacterium]
MLTAEQCSAIEELCAIQRAADARRAEQAAELYEVKHGTPIIDLRSRGEKLRLVDALLRRAAERLKK